MIKYTYMASDLNKEQIEQLDLTSREKEILDLLLDGKSFKEIAYELNIAYSTGKFHQKNLYQKLGVTNIKELHKKYFSFGKDKEPEFIFENWMAISDPKSTSQVTRKNEEIGGKRTSAVTIAGMLYDDPEYPRSADGYSGLDMPFSGAYVRADTETLKLLRTARAISFSFKGDGARYYMRLPTFETIEGDHWLNIFPTVKDEISAIKINIPDDLFRLGWSGKEAEFMQDNIMFVQIQPVDPGNYEFKFWDIKLYQ